MSAIRAWAVFAAWAVVVEKKQLAAEEAAVSARLWKKMLKLNHPGRFAHEPYQLANRRRPLV
ncbi:MAG TPA: hypothetical protein VMU04_22860 [Candidatus Acidoferrum sp.]|nr:hypothetical protein [Candidatus Acidoferrum sp.]